MVPDFDDGQGVHGLPNYCRHILVVEDEPLISMFACEALRDVGFVVLDAWNADEALDILKSGKAIDLIFSDVRMPGLIDGLGLLDFVRKQFPAIPVILTSGHLEPDIAIAHGAATFVSKPYDVINVVDAIMIELSSSA